MNDRDASPSAYPRARRAANLPADDDARASSSFERPAIADTTLTASSSDARPPPSEFRALQTDRLADGERRHLRGARPSKHRASGAFLLSDPIPGDANRVDRIHAHKRRSLAHGARTGRTASARTGGASPSTGTPPSSVSSVADGAVRPRGLSFDRAPSGSVIARHDASEGDTPPADSPRASSTALDIDSTQIVNMALNLSESRRQAAKRNTSQPLPPRLAPLPDSSTGGSLRQHLQQQRRVSRTISPKPDRAGSRTVSSGTRVASPLQANFESQEAGYRYRFSQSTLARAQKARDYIELLAQCRRALNFVPPLELSRVETRTSTSPPASPNGSVRFFRLPIQDGPAHLGRPYNPLQYIRNRKVRARERKSIDGEALGFSHVIKVTEWVDELEAWATGGGNRTSADTMFPPFASAEEDAMRLLSPSNEAGPVLTVTKPKRPRLDWVINPADLIADLWWLEQGDNKLILEDRHWRRVFPPDAHLHQPLSRDHATRETTPVSLQEQLRQTNYRSAHSPASDVKPSRPEHDRVFGGARDRAHDKIRALKGGHRHSGSLRGRDLLRMNRSSVSESSDDDSEGRKKSQKGSIDSTGRSILEKQMLEMFAREQRGSGSDPQPPPNADVQALPPSNVGDFATPDREKPRFLPFGRRARSQIRRDSRADLSEADSYKAKTKPLSASPPERGRRSLDVPTQTGRSSAEYDSTAPNSPELKPIGMHALAPLSGADLSPTSSRPGSPTRNPPSKFKGLFRDRSKERERTSESHGSAKEDGPMPTVAGLGGRVGSSRAEDEKATSMEEKRNRSPARKKTTRGAESSHKTQKSLGSIRHRGEDGGPGLRGLFRGPRIDSVLRSGVSKVGDLLWRKDIDSSGVQTPGTSSDESERQGRGRPVSFAIPSRTSSQGRIHPQGQQQTGKSYLDVLPSFNPAADVNSALNGRADQNYAPQQGPRAPSRRSSRFDLLKPPRIASPQSSSPPPTEVIRPAQDLDATTDASRVPTYMDGVRAADARLNAVLSLPKPPRPYSGDTKALRHWSITGTDMPLRAPLSKREAARLRALILSSGIRAKEIERRARDRKLLTSPKAGPAIKPLLPQRSAAENLEPFSWAAVVELCPDPAAQRELTTRPVAKADMYRVAGHVLGQSIQAAGQQWQGAADVFATQTAPELHARVEALRTTLAGTLSERTRRAADEADEVIRDLAVGQRLQVKRVEDVMENMLRRKRRRFRWARRATWLVIEWFVVGCMWWLWFLYLLWRSVAGIGRGVVGGMRWLLWL